MSLLRKLNFWSMVLGAIACGLAARPSQATGSTARLTLQLPTDLREGDGLRSNAGGIVASVVPTTNLVVHVESSNPSDVGVPFAVTIPAGQSNAAFDISVGDDALFNGRRNVSLTANASGFIGATNFVSMADNELHGFTFSPIASPQTMAVPFNVTVTARTVDGERLTTFSGNTGLITASSDGPVAFSPTTAGPFVGGQWSGEIVISNWARLVRLRTTGASGESEPFYVEPPAFRRLSQANADIAWHENSATLFATVPPNGGVYSNRVVAIDPISARVTNSYAIGDDPSQMELSGTGDFMYVALSNRNAFARFNLANRETTLRYGTGYGPGGLKWIRDFAVVNGAADSVAATFGDSAGNSAGTWRYDSGSAVALNTFSSLDPYRLESSPTAGTLYGFHGNNTFPLMRGAAVPGSTVTVVSNLVSHMFGNDIIHRFGVIYDNYGQAVHADTFTHAGFYPGLMGWRVLAEVDPERNRTIYLATGSSGSGSINYKIKAFDRTSFTPLAEVRAPNLWTAPGRFLRLGTNGFAYNAGGEIWFVRSETIQPTQPPADLELTQTAAPLPVTVRSNVTYTLSLSNRGPNLATSVRVSNALPANVTVVGSSSSTGVVTQSGGVLLWTVAELGIGSGATLEFTIQHAGAGWHTNRAVVSAYEPDSNSSNNVASLVTFVQLPSSEPGAYVINLPVEDVVYDPARQRLLLSVTNAGGVYTNGIAIFNPNSGTVESFVPLGRKPAKLARSDDGQFLYVSFKDDALVRRLHLSSLTTSLEFGLGGDTHNNVYYPYYAADLTVLPGNAGSAAIWRVRRAGPEALEFSQGIGIYDNGVLRSNVTENRLTYALEFDSDANTLYALTDDRTLRRCVVTSDGVSFADALVLDYDAGSDIEYASGRMVTARGRAVSLTEWQATGIYGGAEDGSLVEPDSALGRVYFLVNREGEWRLHAYDLDTFDPRGSLTIPNVAGMPTSLIRWGSEGLAFRTTSGQLIIVRDSLVAPELAAAADLRAIQTVSQETVGVHSNVTFTVMVTNQGPAMAENVVLTNTLVGNVSNVAAFCSLGTCMVSNNIVRWSLDFLPAGEVGIISITARTVAAGTVVSVGSVRSTISDERLSDNLAMAIAQVVTTNSNERIIRIQLAAQDLIWDSQRSRILATISTNVVPWAGGIASIDPNSGQVAYTGMAGNGANEMALSDDGTKLFVGVAYGIQELDAATMTRGARYAVNPGGTAGQPGDIEAVPGSQSKVVVWWGGLYDSAVALYDSGVMQPNTLPYWVTRLEFGDATNRCYMLSPGYFPGGRMQLGRFDLNPNGLAVVGRPVEFGTAGDVVDISFDAGRLYTGRGSVFDADTLAIAGNFPGGLPGSMVLPAVAAGRVFFLTAEGSNWVVSAWDPNTYGQLGRVVVPGVTGTPSTLIRCGDVGLAFKTTDGHVFVVRTSMLPTSGQADLGLTLNSPTSGLSLGSNFVYSLAVTNRGQGVATNVTLLMRLPGHLPVLGIEASQGSGAVTDQLVRIDFGAMTPGSAATGQVRMAATMGGPMVATATVTSESTDPHLGDNSVSVTNFIPHVLRSGQVVYINQRAADLVRDQTTDRLYASGSGGTISVIDPARALVEREWPLGAEAGRLTLSKDGQRLYAAVEGGTKVVRVNTTSGAKELEFMLPDGVTLADWEVLPGRAGSIVVSGGTRIYVLDDGVARERMMSDSSGAAYLEFGTNVNVVYANGSSLSGWRRFRTLAIDDTGIGEVSWREGLPSTLGDIEFAGGLLYSTSGRVLGTNGVVLGQVGGLGTSNLVEASMEQHALAYLTKIGTNWHVRVYDPANRAFIGSLSVSNVVGTPRSLVRWGQDGLAFCTTSNQIGLLRTELMRPQADDDNDGMENGWEIVHGLNPAAPEDSGEDVDDDGHSNLEEYRAGTDPRDSASALRIDSVWMSGGSLNLRFHSVAGRSYSIEEKESLGTGTWTARLADVQATNGLTTVTLNVAPFTPLRFYRVSPTE